MKPAIGAALVLCLTAACAGGGARTPPPIILATTTSTYDSGLLDDIIPSFEKKSGMTVKTIAVGSGKALALAERGEADLLLVHAPEAEEKFMEDGGGTVRRRMMYNDFVLVGPQDDPAKVGGSADLNVAMKKLHRSRAVFVSRGDGSGTHEMELKLWKRAGLEHPKKGYLETGQGMSSTLSVASEKHGYTLTDRGTFLSQQSHLFLVILFEDDPALRNIYHVIVVDPKRGARVNNDGAMALARYLLSEETLALVGDFGREKFGRSLFVPDAEPFDRPAGPSTAGVSSAGKGDASHP